MTLNAYKPINKLKCEKYGMIYKLKKCWSVCTYYYQMRNKIMKIQYTKFVKVMYYDE